jgi:hypothetical protein
MLGRIPLKGTEVRLFVFAVCCVVSGLCEGVILPSEKSYRRACQIGSDLETSTMRWPRSGLGYWVTENKCTVSTSKEGDHVLYAIRSVVVN